LIVVLVQPSFFQEGRLNGAASFELLFEKIAAPERIILKLFLGHRASSNDS
jgi:hypothetical protein